ncbi:N-acetylmuramoyl-L-alanine amidase-like protein [Basidiobolus meristosporus CBS 931.73]|uniref:N-acetylmuramoyl-L-alanine amidase n=1 Tax=Basidiobolus meristosporus CBS 931.73 TaxID=1314790 RepID=A0A1Y1XST2_9FUNG|nr:N-acetylmuramoyl-L-alanine amidase-like protein [Basidiobolus meristosporus CBS 931.73]|eukprot:ORX88745.1 N-acetylmuramoyl-L-alanine amidase-like protein [Basidiobolus meristosporus CBS 931.73]
MKFLSVSALLFLATLGSVNCQADEPGALWIGSPNFFANRHGLKPTYLIVHGTAGFTKAEDVGHWFADPSSQVASHYVVGQDGKVVQCVKESDGAWANGGKEPGADYWWTDSSANPNDRTISIEHVKPKTDNSNELTAAQKTATFKLIKNIIARNPGIRVGWADASGGITGHYSMQPQSRARCPGPFPWAEMFKYLNGGNGGASTGTVTSSTPLNVRSSAGTGGTVVGTLAPGAKVTILCQVSGESIFENPRWYKVSNGYVSGYYIKALQSSPPC